ncbi:hypothetical protein PINS_up012909 [Pythium insidiosum]|nr:hypothetical protein PINS_up012909 [Pythium insidiosum]
MPPLRMKDSDALSIAARVQSLLLSERDYLSFLDAIEDALARRLRFHAATASSDQRSALSDVAFVCFFQHARLLAYLHRVTLNKVEPLSSADHPDPSAMAVAVCELLVATRFTYAQLQCQRESIAHAIDLRGRSDDGDVVEASIVRGFLRDQQLNARELVARPLHHLQELLETVELIFGSPDVTAVCRDTRAFIASVQDTAANEQALMDLQCRLDWSSLPDARVDLCGKRLVAKSDQVQALISNSDNKCNHLRLSRAALQAAAPLRVIHCLDDGHVLLSTATTASDDKLRVERVVNLRQEAVALEEVPLAVSECPAVALISQDSSAIIAVRDETHEALAAAMGRAIEQSETDREQALRSRSAANYEVPSELAAAFSSLSPTSSSVVFPSLHDDLLAGLFWLRQGDEQWTLVELVRVDDRFVLALAVTGWQRHRLVCAIDTTSEVVEISEQPHDAAATADGRSAWSLVVRGATTTATATTADGSTAVTIELLSTRRTRIDFWYDEVSKALESARVARQKRKRLEQQAARRAERERERELEREERAKKKKATTATAADAASTATVAENGDDDDDEFISARGKKKRGRQSTTELDAPQPAATAIEEEGPAADNSTVAATPQRSSTRKRRPPPPPPVAALEQDEGVAATPPSSADAVVESVRPPSARKQARTPQVKTPKQRWVRRKIEDPHDEQLQPTPQGSAANGDADGAEASSEQPAPEQEASTIRIIFTGIEPSAKIFKKISSIASAVYEENVERATHVIAPRDQLKRTVKLLCGISCCDHILDERWLNESARVGMAVYERQFCLKDSKAEAKWGFDLLKTMYDFTKDQRRQLFHGHRVFITPHASVLPPVHDLVRIVECAGGTAVTTGAALATDVVVTTDAAMATAPVQRMLSSANPQRLYTPELVLSSILQQHLDFDRHRVAATAADATGSKRRRR